MPMMLRAKSRTVPVRMAMVMCMPPSLGDRWPERAAT